MQDILFNLALLDTINFCKEQNIDCAGSHLEKAGRGFRYTLISDTYKRPLVTVEFKKMAVPEHSAFLPMPMTEHDGAYIAHYYPSMDEDADENATECWRLFTADMALFDEYTTFAEAEAQLKKWAEEDKK